MMVARVALAILLALGARADVTITFPAALDRAMSAPASDFTAILDALPSHTLPTVRAETTYSNAENLNLLTESPIRLDAVTAIVSVDYPLLDIGADRRRLAALRADAQLLRSRARDESDRVFHETLDAFAQLYLAEQRIQLLRDSVASAASLRQRARTKLEAGEISNITAARWQDQALATESALLDLELQRLDAETRLKQLIGDSSSESLRAFLDLEDHPITRTADVETDFTVTRASLALQEATALRRPQLLLSAFGGVAETNLDDGTLGIYGVRLSLTLPMVDAASARRIAEARIQLEEATRVRAATETATRNRIDLLRLAMSAAEKRLALMQNAVDVAKQRQESVARLVVAGVRPEADLVDAANEIARRESDLLAVRVEKWKLAQQLRYQGAEGRAQGAGATTASLLTPAPCALRPGC